MATHDLSEQCPSPSWSAAPPLGKMMQAHLCFQAHVLGGHCLPPQTLALVPYQLSAPRPSLGMGVGHSEVPCSAHPPPPSPCQPQGLGAEVNPAPPCALACFSQRGSWDDSRWSPTTPTGNKASTSALRGHPDPGPLPPLTSVTTQTGPSVTLEAGIPLGAWVPDPKCWSCIPREGVV